MKNKKTKTKAKILFAVLVIAALAIALATYFGFFKKASNEVILIIESGEVQVDYGKGWQNAENGSRLDVTTKVKTLNGTALISFSEDAVIRLEENTEIEIKQLKDEIAIEQKYGSTWNKLFHILTGYTVETPTTTAAVRGTAFLIDATDKMISLAVEEGIVEVKTRANETEKVTEFESIKKTGDEPLKKSWLTQEQKRRILKNLIKDIELLKERRLRKLMELSSNPFIRLIAKKYNITKEKIPQLLEDIDSGKINLTEIKARIPLRSSKLDEVYDLNNEIIRIRERIKMFENELKSENLKESEEPE
ncbi:MAG: FecR family protein [Candidatus Pacearchaeota archaeon]